MSIAEIPYRINQLVQKWVLKYSLSVPSKYYFAKQILPQTDLSAVEKQESQVWVFGQKLDYSKITINWHRDIFTDKSFPLKFSKSMSIRKDPGLSAKNVWEINRLQFLPQIAINYRITGDHSILDQFIMLSNSWIDSNPYLLGINWYSNIEINIRLINWFFCWEILRVEELILANKEFERFVNEKWIPVIYQHCLYSYRNPSKYSSSNNHLISEYAGLFIASSKWKFKESDKWLNYARKGLEREIIRQHSNGINREEAAEYIQFITDFFLISWVVGERSGNPFSKSFQKTLKEIMDYIFDLTDIKGNFPQYGDEDDGKVVCFSNEPYFNNFKSLLSSASILFHDHKYQQKSAGYDLKNRILFDDKGAVLFENLNESVNSSDSAFYLEEGHFIFKKQQARKEIYCHFDAAPLGFLSIAAHGHADALSLIMNINGIQVFIDSGTYNYHVAKEWRSYFVSTMAHNTICIDNQNQARQVGDTMWLDHYKCEVLSVMQTEEFELVKASHNGYKNIKHIREVCFNRKSDTFIIEDELEINDGEEHECTILFHLHPDMVITKISSNKVLFAHPSGIKLSLTIEGFDEIKFVKGQENPIIGWYSKSFMQKEPTAVIFSTKKTNLSFQSKTKIEIYEY